MKILCCGSSMLFTEEPGERFTESVPDEAFFLDGDNEPDDAEFDDPDTDDADEDEDDDDGEVDTDGLDDDE